MVLRWLYSEVLMSLAVAAATVDPSVSNKHVRRVEVTDLQSVHFFVIYTHIIHILSKSLLVCKRACTVTEPVKCAHKHKSLKVTL